MIRALLFISFFLTVGVTLTFAQPDLTLGQASDFAVLASTSVSNTGTTAVIGNLGVASGVPAVDAGALLVFGEKYNMPATIAGMADAKRAYDFYSSQPVTSRSVALGNSYTPGVYVIDGDAVLNGILYLNAQENINARFVFIVKGGLKTNLPTPVAPSNSVLLVNGAQAKNVYWIMEDGVDLRGISIFQGNIVAKKDITLHTGVGVIGRVISLEGSVNLNSNNIYLPTVIYANLSVTKVVDPDQVIRVGGEVSYTITVKNSGPGIANGVYVEEIFPADKLEFLRVEPAGSSFTKTADGTYRWNIGTLERDREVKLKVFFKILTPGSITNKVNVTGIEPDPSPGDNNSESPIDVPPLPAADLSVTKTALPGPYAVGGQVTYTVTVRNAGPGAAEGVVVQENIPDGLTLVDAVTVKGSYDRATNKWTVGALANNESAVLTLVFTINKPGELINGVTVVADNTDPTPSDNNSEAPINVPCTTLNVAVTGSTTVCAGEEKTYTTPANQTASSYTWSLPADWVILEGEGSNSIKVRVGKTAGEVAVTVNNLCNNSKSATLSVTVNDKLAAPAITGEAGACIGTRLTYTITAVTGATGYAWTVPTTWRLVSGQNTRSITVEVGTGSGQVSVGVVNECGTGTAATLDVAPVLAPTETNSIVGNSAVCENGETVTYTLTTVEAGVTYTWAVPAGWTIVSGQETGTITVNTTASAGTVSVVATNACGTAQRISKEVNITVPPVAPGTITDNSNVCDGLTYSISGVQGATGYTWTVPAGFTITSGQGTTTIKVTANNPTATGEVTVAAMNGANGTCAGPATSAPINASLADGQLNFPKAFSPNGDGKNDTWEIKNLEKYPANEVVIFNRWGSEVYKTKNYQNDWSASKLEQGTYFYKVRVTLCEGVVKEFTGYTTLFR